MANIGYARERYTGESMPSQIQLLMSASCEFIYQDTARGSHCDRPELASCLKALSRGDVLITTRLDRLINSIFELIDLAGMLKERGIGLVILGSAIDTRTETGRHLFTLLVSLADFEDQLRVEWQAEGIAKARGQGVKFGRPRKINESRQEEVYLRRMAGATIEQLANEFDVGKASIYRALSAVKFRELQNEKKQ